MLRLFLLIMLTTNAGYFNSTLAGTEVDNKQPLILVIGDSLSSGHGIDPEKGWVSLLRHRLKQKSFSYQLVNASISGDTTANGLQRLPALLTEYRPAYVLIELGGNDGLRGLSLTSMKNNLSTMISLAHQSGAKVLLAGIKIPPNYGKKYTQAFYRVYQSLSADYNIPLIPFLLDKVGGQAELMQNDGIHPTAAAQSIILDNAWPYINTMLSMDSAGHSSTATQ